MVVCIRLVDGRSEADLKILPSGKVESWLSRWSLDQTTKRDDGRIAANDRSEVIS